MSNPFVVDQLTPTNSTGASTKTYQLSKASVSPTRHIGRDARGFPIEDTLPTVYWRWFLSADGCMNKVPLRTGSVPTAHADASAYEAETTQDLIMAGWIPGWLCPYSSRYAHITNGPFAAPPDGVTDCGGSDKEGGCEHLQAIAKMRKAGVLEAYDLEKKRFAAERDVEHKRMVDGIISGVGQAIANATPHQAQTAARNRMRDGKGEVEAG